MKPSYTTTTPAVKQVSTDPQLSPCRDPRGDHQNGLVPRPLAHQTYEQKYCGIWEDCPYCGFSRLTPSESMKRDWAAMQSRRLTTSNLFAGSEAAE